MDLTNKFLVKAGNSPPRKFGEAEIKVVMFTLGFRGTVVLGIEDALNLAAWLVTLAEPSSPQSFSELLEIVKDL